MSLRAVIFDLGGVLIDWRPEAALAHLFGGDEAAARAALADVDLAAFSDAIDAPADAPPPEPAHLFAAYRDGVDRAHRDAMPETVAILETLAAAGTPLYALSNAARKAGEAVRRLHPFMALFRDVVISAEVGLSKPDPAVWRLLLDRNGLAAQACVYIDDAQTHVDAAAALGLRAIRFESARQLRAALGAEGVLP